MAAIRRGDLQAVAQAKIDDAQHLLSLRRYSNAYYLAGYAIEIGLKACIAKQFSADTIPDRKFVMDVHVHDLKKLIGLSGLTSALKQREAGSPQFAANWALTTEWSPEIRYEAVDAMLAQFMISAITESVDGVPAVDQNRMVTNGHDLLDALDSKGMPIGAAMWVHNTDVDTWKLWIVPRQKTDKREFYKNVAEVISNDSLKFSGIDASDTEFVLQSHPAIKGLSNFAKVSGKNSIRMKNNMLNGYYMNDGIIILMDL